MGRILGGHAIAGCAALDIGSGAGRVDITLVRDTVPERWSASTSSESSWISLLDVQRQVSAPSRPLTTTVGSSTAGAWAGPPTRIRRAAGQGSPDRVLRNQ